MIKANAGTNDKKLCLDNMILLKWYGKTKCNEIRKKKIGHLNDSSTKYIKIWKGVSWVYKNMISVSSII